MTWPLVRGQVVQANLQLNEPKLVLVVSNNRRNSNLETVLAVRLTTSPKPDIPSIVELAHPEVFIGRVVCDDIFELWEDEVIRVVGGVTGAGMAAVEAGLRAALDLN